MDFLLHNGNHRLWVMFEKNYESPKVNGKRRDQRWKETGRDDDIIFFGYTNKEDKRRSIHTHTYQ